MIDSSKLTEEQKKIIIDYANGHNMTFDEAIAKANLAIEVLKEVAKEIVKVMRNLVEAIKKAFEAICDFIDNNPGLIRVLLRINTNNWRKMHRLPLRRRIPRYLTFAQQTGESYEQNYSSRF